MSPAWSRSSVPLPLLVLLVAPLLSCNEEPISFPSHPPSSGPRYPPPPYAVPVDQATLRKLAGPGARDCGTASGPESATAVHRCAAEAFARRERFFCRFAGARDGVSPAPTPDGLVWYAPATYVGTGSSIAIAEEQADRQTVLTDLLRRQPLFVGSGMTQPVPLAGPVAVPSSAEASGLVIVSALVGSDGRARDASLLKPLAMDDVNRAALDLVTSSPFEPARLFGVPVEVITSISVQAGHGVIRFVRIRPDQSGRTVVIEGQAFPVAESPPSPAPDDVRPSFPAKVFDPAPDIRPPVAVSRAETRSAAGDMKCRGMVLLRAVIDEQGRVVAVADLSSNPDAFTRAYANGLYAWTFRPATRDSVPVAYNFTLAVYIKCA